jgi:hypothetical protein
MGCCHDGGGGEAGGFHGALVGGPVGGVEVLGPQGPGGVLPGGGGAGGANDDGGAAAGAGGGGATWVTSFSPGVSTLVASAGGGGGVDTGGAAGGGGAAAAAAERRGWPQPVQNAAAAGTSVPQLEHVVVSLTRSAFRTAGVGPVCPTVPRPADDQFRSLARSRRISV